VLCLDRFVTVIVFVWDLCRTGCFVVVEITSLRMSLLSYHRVYKYTVALKRWTSDAVREELGAAVTF